MKTLTITINLEEIDSQEDILELTRKAVLHGLSLSKESWVKDSKKFSTRTCFNRAKPMTTHTIPDLVLEFTGK